MNEESRFIGACLIKAIRICGPMLLRIEEEHNGEAAISATVTVEDGPLAGRRVKLEFTLVKDDED